jgi:excisionase family DNA binding protein/PAS domain S-box-containing protein
VTEVAHCCGVGRSTVGYWIRSGKLPAERVGRDYTIAAQDLLLHLTTVGKPVPDGLRGEARNPHPFPPFRSCWEHRASTEEGADCTGCGVYRKGMRACFAGRRHVVPGRVIHCHLCGYYQDHIGPRIGFIHQIDSPAVVYEGLYIWGGNERFSEMSGFSPEELPGLDMERLIHPDSLGTVISNIKLRALGSPKVPSRYEVFVRKRGGVKARTEICVQPLREPSGTFLILLRDLGPGGGGAT